VLENDKRLLEEKLFDALRESFVQVRHDLLDMLDVFELKQIDVFDQANECFLVLHSDVYHFADVLL